MPITIKRTFAEWNAMTEQEVEGNYPAPEAPTGYICPTARRPWIEDGKQVGYFIEGGG